MSEDGEHNDGARRLIDSMGWETLPYGCVGMARMARVGETKTAWSWLILIPWAVNDSKPWIDGTRLMDKPLSSEDEQRDEVFAEMRAVLDQRYGESVGQRAADDLLRSLDDEL